MDKVVISEKIRENAKFNYEGVEIEVISYISVVDEIALISDYVQRYFRPDQDATFSYIQKGDFDYWQSEYALIQRVMETMTNVDTVETKADEMVEIFYEVIRYIENYSQFRDRLDNTIQAIKDSKSIGIVIDNLSKMAIELFESFSNIDPEKLKEVADSIVQKIESSSVAPIFDEANKQATIEKQSKTRKVKESKVE